jgi:hypothetical protein
MFRSPWLPLIAAGFGMLAGRSPQALNNVGQGGLEGIKMMQSQGEQGLRERTLQNEVATRQQQRDLEQQRINQTGTYQTSEMAQRERQYQQSMKAENDRFAISMKQATTAEERADALAKHYENSDTINAGYRGMLMAKPIAGYRQRSDGSIEYGTQTFNPNTGGYDFTPGATVGKPAASTVQNPTVTAEKREAAIRLEAQRLGTAFAAGHPGEAVPNFRPQAETNVNKTLGAAPAATSAAPSTSPAATQQWTHTATGPGGQTVHSNDGKTWYNPDGTPYQPPAAATTGAGATATP